jgi:uncharacterized protein YdhG (YjbR/CyaY superfamily)
MVSSAADVNAYMAALPEERKEAIQNLRDAINANIPKGFEETMSYGMIGYVVPHSIYKAGYHCNATLPLPFMNIASQKNFIAIYHMGIYADPELMKWFTEEYAKVCKGKLDMGKSCIRFKKLDDIPFALIGKLAKKITPTRWIDIYEQAFVKK